METDKIDQTTKEVRLVKTILIIFIVLLVIVIFLIIFFAILNFCLAPRSFMPSTAQVDVAKLTGLWYPLAYMETDFNFHCDKNGDLYSWLIDFDNEGNFILKECCTASGGTSRCSANNMFPVSYGSFAFDYDLGIYTVAPGKFATNNIWSQGFWFFNMDTSADPQWFVAINPTRSNFWFVSRSTSVSCTLLNQQLKMLAFNGFNINKVVYQPKLLNSQNLPCT